ncbi:hypothetical protein SUDANB6_00333 [Streptomyces sp. enrichment culture]
MRTSRPSTARHRAASCSGAATSSLPGRWVGVSPVHTTAATPAGSVCAASAPRTSACIGRMARACPERPDRAVIPSRSGLLVSTARTGEKPSSASAGLWSRSAAEVDGERACRAGADAEAVRQARLVFGHDGDVPADECRGGYAQGNGPVEPPAHRHGEARPEGSAGEGRHPAAVGVPGAQYREHPGDRQAHHDETEPRRYRPRSGGRRGRGRQSQCPGPRHRTDAQGRTRSDPQAGPPHHRGPPLLVQPTEANVG